MSPILSNRNLNESDTDIINLEPGHNIKASVNSRDKVIISI